MKKKIINLDVFLCGAICVLFLCLVYFLIKGGYMYGSETDWETQHWAIPEYFRTLFYDTHQLIPSFAYNIGGGQNIFNLSYYGLFSPIILFSYLLPFVEMVDYIQVSSVIVVLASIIIFYIWLRTKYGRKVSFVSTFIFTWATPLIFHSHRHIMFINYMPFMVLALIGVDRYFKKNKKTLLIVSSFLIIMTSYFFSVGALIAISVYGISVYLDIYGEDFNVKHFIIEAMKFAGSIIVSVCMAAVLLLPTAYTLLSGRSETNVNIAWKEILLPSFNMDLTMYGSYSLGLSAVFIASIVFCFYRRKKGEIFLGIVMGIFTIFPVFAYVLNGMMYVDGKALIPFLPVAGYMISIYYNGLIEKEYKFVKLLVILIIVNVLLTLMVSEGNQKCFISDYIGIICTYVVYSFISYNNSWIKNNICKSDKHKQICDKFSNFQRWISRYNIPYLVLVLPIIIATFWISADINKNDNLCKKKMYQDNKAETVTKLINSIGSDNTSNYRVSNRINLFKNVNRIYSCNELTTSVYSSVGNGNYNNFFFEEINNNNPYRNSAILSHNDNLLFNFYMGNKYIIAEEGYNVNGYKCVDSDNECFLYENERALPIAYASDKILPLSKYEELKFPYNVEALLKYIIVDDKVKYNYVSNIKKNDEKYDMIIPDNIDISEISKGRYRINVDDDCVDKITEENINEVYSRVKIRYKEKLENKLSFIKFNVDNTIKTRKVKSKVIGKDGSEKTISSKGDTCVRINGVLNKLTIPTWKYYNKNESFEYVISPNKNISTLNIDFYYGTYDIYDLESYCMDYSILDDIRKSVDEFKINDSKTYGDIIEGTINVTNDGYFKLSIPYDKGFSISVDGKKVDYEKVDTSFIGFKINKGEHNIVIKYTSPLLVLGKIVSVIGFIVLGMIIYFEKRKVKN